MTYKMIRVIKAMREALHVTTRIDGDIDFDPTKSNIVEARDKLDNAISEWAIIMNYNEYQTKRLRERAININIDVIIQTYLYCEAWGIDDDNTMYESPYSREIIK